MNKVIRRVSCLLLVLVFVFTTGCGKETEKTEVPEDFQFSLTWGTYGISAYDSATGKLVKTSHATTPDDYVTTVFLDEATMVEIYNLLMDLDLESYPDIYDPINAPDAELKILSKPSQTLILTVHVGEVSKTVECDNIAAITEGYDDKAQAFLDACARIEEFLTATEEWLALPDYEFRYL